MTPKTLSALALLPALALALPLAAPSAARAQAAPESFGGASDVDVESRIDAVFEVGAGGLVSPTFEGSDDYELTPYPIIGLDYLSIPGLFTVGSLKPQGGGLSIGPSFGYSGERDEPDALEGLSDVDATYEAGVKLGYEWTFAEVYGEARLAFGGADGLVGAAGANAVARPNAALELKAGPRLTFATDGYMDAYFAVSPEESARSGGRFESFDPDGGLKSVGVLASARYEFVPDWFLNARGSYERLVSDAGDSPVVEAGSRDQFTVGLGLSKRFSLDLF